MAIERVFTLSGQGAGERVDRFIAKARADLSRNAVQRLIDEGQVKINGESVTRASTKVRDGDCIEVRVPPPKPSLLEAEPLPLDILYEDGDILVVNKAAGMVVHPGAGNRSGTLVNALLAHCSDLQGVGGELRPGIVHRLDKDTSGVIVVAKHDQAIRALQRQFRHRTVKKRYIALLIGDLIEAEGIIEAPIGRHHVHRKKMAVLADGKAARTRWRILAHYCDAEQRPYTLIRVHLLTGRTHQIRVHFSWLGYPVLGDRTYGPAHSPLPVPRQFLHAQVLTLVHPGTGEDMTFSAPLPEDLERVLVNDLVKCED